MKRLCIFYRKAKYWQKKPVAWIVCKECQRKLRQGLISVLITQMVLDYREEQK
jgi:hypothetical protein